MRESLEEKDVRKQFPKKGMFCYERKARNCSMIGYAEMIGNHRKKELEPTMGIVPARGKRTEFSHSACNVPTVRREISWGRILQSS